MAKRSPRREHPETSKLHGKRIVITRTREQSRNLATRLTELGAEVIVCPAIAIIPPGSYDELDAAIQVIARYHWIIFTSANAVRAFLERFTLALQPVDALAQIRMAAVGSATAEALTESLRAPDLTPELFQADAILPLIGNVREQRILLPTADIGRDLLAKVLRERGAEVDTVVAYRTVASAEISELAEIVRSCAADAIVFASPSGVRYASRALGELGVTPASLSAESKRPAFICIGDVTAGAARELGLPVDATAAEHSTEGLVAAITDWFESRDENVAT